MKMAEEMRAGGVQLTDEQMESMISEAAMKGGSAAAEEVYLQMLESGSSPGTRSYQALLIALQRSRDWGGSLKYYEKMRAEGIAGDVRTHSALLTALEKGRQFGKVIEKMKELQEEGLQLDVLCYTAAVNSCAKMQNITAAQYFWQEMKAKGMRPDQACYDAMIMVHVNFKLCTEAKGYIDEMDAADVPRSAMTHLADTFAVSQLGTAQEAVDKLFDLRSHGIEPNMAVINGVLDSLVKHRAPDLMPNVICVFRQANLQPNSQSYAKIITTYASRGLGEEAVMVLRRMINDPQRLAVPMSCVETILRCCIGNETLDDAVGVITLCEERPEPILVKDEIVAQVLDALVDAQRWQEVQKLFQQFNDRRDGRAERPLYRSLMRAMEAGQNWEGALEVISMMGSAGVDPGAESYRIASRVCQRAGEVNLAKQLQKHMAKLEGAAPS
jgi:pentatricopeptide repeat protein